MNDILEKLLSSDEPSIWYKVRVNVLGEKPESPEIVDLRSEIRKSPRVRALLAERDDQGRIEPAHKPYSKWRGAHWVFASLADIGYPTADPDLIPIRDQVFDCWLSPDHMSEQVVDGPSHISRGHGIPIINGRARRCGSQQGNALYSAVALGLIDDRCRTLADLLIKWQWPDGGWNCDSNPDATNSSFHETLIPLRALSLYGRVTGESKYLDAAERAADIFLKRRLIKRVSDGKLINPKFILLHYPCYWHYDFLFGLKVMSEAGFVNDQRCVEALDLLESKQLPDGGWPAEECYYTASNSNSERVSWGGTGKKKMNEWVTADALYVLKASGRLI